MWRWNLEREVGGGVEREVERGVDMDEVDAVEVEREVEREVEAWRRDQSTDQNVHYGLASACVATSAGVGMMI